VARALAVPPFGYPDPEQGLLELRARCTEIGALMEPGLER